MLGFFIRPRPPAPEGVPDESPNSCGLRQEPPDDQPAAVLAEAQGGAISRRQLIGASNFTRRTIEHRTRTKKLRRLHRSVYSWGHRELTKRGRLWAAYLATGTDKRDPDGVIGLWAAADMLGLRQDECRVIDVMTPTQRRSTDILKAHHVPNLAPQDIDATVDGHPPCTSWARTILDIAGVATRTRIVEKLFETADDLQLFDLALIEDVRRRNPGHHGLKRFDEALCRFLEEGPQQTESPLEDDFLEFVRRHDLPRPILQFPLGPYRFDAAFLEHGLLVELDGRRYHSSRRARRTDPAKTAYGESRGNRVVRLTWWDVNRDEGRTLARLGLPHQGS